MEMNQLPLGKCVWRTLHQSLAGRDPGPISCCKQAPFRPAQFVLTFFLRSWKLKVEKANRKNTTFLFKLEISSEPKEHVPNNKASGIILNRNSTKCIRQKPRRTCRGAHGSC